MSLTALEFRLTQFEHRLLKRELLLEAGQEVCHLAVIIGIFNAEKRGELNKPSAQSTQHSLETDFSKHFQICFRKSHLKANLLLFFKIMVKVYPALQRGTIPTF